MAIRFDAATDALTGGGVTGTVASIVCWFRVAVDRNDFSNAWSLYNSGTTGLEAGWGTGGNGTQFQLFDAAFSNLTGPDVTVGTWYCMGAVMNGTSWTLYYGTSSGSLTTVGPSTRTAISSPGGITVSDPGDFLNGDIACFKVWSRALSAGDVAAELATYDVVNATNLVRHHRFLTSPGTTNEAGTGGNLTAGGTATATSTGPAALDVLTGDVTSTVTAGASAAGTADHVGATTSTATAGATVTATADHAGSTGSAIVGGSTVTGTAESPGAVTSTITADATVTGSSVDPTGSVTSTITAAATVAGSAEHIGQLGSTITAGASVVATVENYGVVASAITAVVDVAGVDLDAPAVVGPLRAGVPVLIAGWAADDPVLTAGWSGGTPVLAAGWRAGTPT